MPWINVNKPTGTNYTNVAKPSDGGTTQAGAYMGPLGLTYYEDSGGSTWSNIGKPTGTPYTNIAKPTD